MKTYIAFIAVIVVTGLFAFTDEVLAQQRFHLKSTGVPYAPSIEYEVSGVTLGPRTMERLSGSHPTVEYYGPGNFVPGNNIEVKGIVYNNIPPNVSNVSDERGKIDFSGYILCNEIRGWLTRIENIRFGPPGAKRDFSMTAVIPENCVNLSIELIAGGGRLDVGALMRASMVAADKPPTNTAPAPPPTETRTPPTTAPTTPPPTTTPPTTPPPSGTVVLTGEWDINANNYHGKITITQHEGNQFSGRIYGEQLVNGRIDGNKVTFTRLWASGFRQDYTGTLSTGPDGRTTITGSFTQQGTGSYNWTATQTGTAPTGTTPARFTVEAGKRNLSQGGSVTVPVSLNNVEALANMNVNIHYDPAVVRPVRNADRGNIIPQALFEANVRDRGVIRLGFAQRDDIRGTGTLAQIPFEAVGRPGTRTPLRLEVTMASAAAGSRVTPAQLIHGEIVIVGADGRLPGDTSGSGTLTALDAMNALKMSVGNLGVDMVADVDRDGSVTARDATLILQQVVGR